MISEITPTPEALDEATITLIFALRDSLTPASPSRLDFWTGGRAVSALLSAAAGGSSAAEAVTIAARKLQIDQIVPAQAQAVVAACAVIDQDYEAWASHVDATIVYIVALADVRRQAARKTKKEQTND